MLRRKTATGWESLPDWVHAINGFHGPLRRRKSQEEFGRIRVNGSIQSAGFSSYRFFLLAELPEPAPAYFEVEEAYINSSGGEVGLPISHSLSQGTTIFEPFRVFQGTTFGAASIRITIFIEESLAYHKITREIVLPLPTFFQTSYVDAYF